MLYKMPLPRPGLDFGRVYGDFRGRGSEGKWGVGGPHSTIVARMHGSRTTEKRLKSRAAISPEVRAVVL